MRRSMVYITFFILLFPIMAWASINVEIKDVSEESGTARLLIKDHGKIVKSMSIDLNPTRSPPEAMTFPSTYCGKNAQVVIVKTEVSNGEFSGDFYEYLIFNPKNWTVIDDFDGSETYFRNSEKVNSHTGHENTEKLLRAGRYFGPVCRIFDLYTKPLPSSGPSFDCNTASSLAEQTVCKDSKLAALDHAYGASLQKSLRSASPEERQNIANRYIFDMYFRDTWGTNKKEIAQVYEKLLGKSTEKAGSVSAKKTAAATCTQARTPTEGAICGNPALQKLDTEMAVAYHRAFQNTQPNTPARKALIEAQRQWLKTRDACEADAACIEKAYQTRIQALKAS
ncbi:MAG: lysozyme inhibitor LprI family protein [Acidithiobacillus sp.]